MKLNKHQHILFALILVALLLFLYTSGVFTGKFVEKEKVSIEDRLEKDSFTESAVPEEKDWKSKTPTEELKEIPPETQPEIPSITLETESYYEIYDENGNEWGNSGTWTNLANVNDTNWSTEGHAGGTSPSTAYYYVNYTKYPNSAGATVIFRTGYGGGTNYSAQIPSSCWNYDSDKIILRYTSSLFTGSSSVTASCQNATSFGSPVWTNLISGGGDATGHYLYEEAVTWNVTSNISSCVNITASNLEYELVSNLSKCQENSGLTNRCLFINASNITLDCKSFYIASNDSSSCPTGVWIESSQNVTFKNCIISDYYSNGLIVRYSDNVNILNSSINSVVNTGLNLLHSRNITLNNINVTDNGIDFSTQNSTIAAAAYDIKFNQTPTNFIYSGNIQISSSNSSAVFPTELPSGVNEIGIYLNITNLSSNAWILLNVSYNQSALGEIDERWLKLWRHHAEWVYEESGDETPYCSLFWNNERNVYDGDWNTFGDAGSFNVSCQINYTKPANAYNSSIWQFKDGLGTNNMSYLFTQLQFSDPGCWQQSKLMFLAYSDPADRAKWYCYNGTHFVQQFLSAGSGANDIYEEAMYWNIRYWTPNLTAGEIQYSGVNTTADYVYANITNFGSIFGILSEESTEIDECKNITSANKKYTLVQNLTGNLSNGICIDIRADNVTLDCAGYNITGTYPGKTYGINIEGYDNITLVNCTISNYSVGFRTANSENSNYTDITFSGNAQDMLALGFSENTTAFNFVFNDSVSNFTYRGEFRIGSAGDPGGYDSYQTSVDGFINISELPNFKKYYTFSSSHEVYDIERTEDGGYIMLMDYGSIVLLKLDAFGDPEWNKTYSFGSSRMGRAVKQTSDRGYVVAGQVYNSGDYDFLLFKVDRYGNEEWNKSYSNSLYDIGLSLDLTSDGGYVIAGATAPSATYLPFVLKLNSTADEEWNYTDLGTGFAYAVMQTNDGGYAFCGDINDMFITKLNSTGSKEWSYSKGDSGSNCDSFDQAVDNGYILAGQSSSNTGLLVKLNSTGALNWSSTANVLSSTELYSVREISDGYFVAIGTGWTGARYVPIYARANLTGAIMYSYYGTSLSYAAVCNQDTMEPSGGDIGVVFGCRGGTSGYPFLQKLNYEAVSSNQLNQWMLLNMSYDESKAVETEDAISLYRMYYGLWSAPNLFSASYGTDTSNDVTYANLTSFDTGNYAVYAPIEDADPCELRWTKTLTEDLSCPSGLNIYSTGKLNTNGYDVTANGGTAIYGQLNATGNSVLDFSDSPTEVYNGGVLGSNDWNGDIYANYLIIDYNGTLNATSGTIYVSEYIELNGTYNYNNGIIQIGFGGLYPTNMKFENANNIRILPVFPLPPSNPGYSEIGYYVEIENITESGGFSGGYFNITYNDMDPVNEKLLLMWRFNGTDWTSTDGFNDNGVNTSANYVYSVPLTFGIFAPMEQETTIANCVNITEPDIVYTVNAPISGVQSGWDRCIYINASNVILDCYGYMLSGSGMSGDDYGVYVENADNITLTSCLFSGYNITNILVNNSNNSNILDSYLYDTGVAVYNVRNLTFWNNSIANIVGNGFYAMNMFYSNISENLVYYCSEDGTQFYNSSGNTFENNIINNNSRGLNIKNSNNNIFAGNVFNENNEEGISITFVDSSLSDNNIFTNNTASYNDVWDVYSAFSYNNTFNNLTMNDVTASFTYNGEIGIKQTSAPAGDPSGYLNLGSYINVTNATNAWIFLNITYDETSVINESNIKLLRWDETKWNTVTGSAVNETQNYVYANLSEFSVFAPMEEILNQIPTTTTPTIEPSPAYDTDNLECYATLEDAENDTFIAYWTWYRNDTAYLSGSTNIINATNERITTLLSGNLSAGDEWICEITPYDWVSNGTAVNSSAETILSSASIFSSFEVNDTNHNIYAEYSTSISDVNGLSACRIEHNNSGIFVNTSLVYLSGTNDWCDIILLNNNSNNANITWYVWSNDTLGNWVRSEAQSFLTTNTLPVLTSASSNATNITEGTAVRLATSGADDYNDDNLRLECGYSNGASDTCVGSYGTGERTCAFSWPFDDNENHTLYCRLNDSYGVSTPDFELNITGYTPRFRIAVQHPLNGSHLNYTDVWFNITLNKNASTCLLDFDGTGNITMGNSSPTFWHEHMTALSEAQHNVTYWCSRYDGYENDSRVIYFEIDLTEPFINITLPVNGTTLTSSGVTVRATTNEIVSACLAEFDSATNVSMSNTSGNWNVARTLSNGNHNITVYCSDLAGNWNSSNTVYFAVNTTTITVKRGGGVGSGLQPNITVNEILEKQGFFVYLDYLQPNVHYQFPFLWPADLRITHMTFDSYIEDQSFTARVVDSVPATAPTGNVYKYFIFDLDRLKATPTKVDFAFRTSIGWLESTGAKVQNMKLYAYDGIIWHELDTIVDRSDGTYVLFNSTDTALYKIYAIAESGVQAGKITFVQVIYTIEKYYKGEIDFIEVLDTISEYYMQNK